MSDPILDPLTEERRAACPATDKHIIVQAGAGKTRILIHRAPQDQAVRPGRRPDPVSRFLAEAGLRALSDESKWKSAEIAG